MVAERRDDVPLAFELPNEGHDVDQGAFGLAEEAGGLDAVPQQGQPCLEDGLHRAAVLVVVAVQSELVARLRAHGVVRVGDGRLCDLARVRDDDGFRGLRRPPVHQLEDDWLRHLGRRRGGGLLGLTLLLLRVGVGRLGRPAPVLTVVLVIVFAIVALASRLLVAAALLLFARVLEPLARRDDDGVGVVLAARRGELLLERRQVAQGDGLVDARVQLVRPARVLHRAQPLGANFGDGVGREAVALRLVEVLHHRGLVQLPD
mmetsp:Transcript_47755/g.147313  ORF Transcript_47755/g.147313 Transcript_47755/m.147313 type:complete len:261 (-) Transcript_47755:455-1237(-)